MKKILSGLAIIILITACKKTELPVQPLEEIATTSDGNNLNKNLEVTTLPVTPGSAISVNVGGRVSLNGGGNSLVEFGFCYSTSPDPTIANDTIHVFPFWQNDNPVAASFSGTIRGLTAGTTYYAKAYGMKNNGDVYYGNEINFTTLTLGLPGPGIGTVTDIDGNVYNTITLGTQVWMVENLKTTRYRDGTPINHVTDNAAWANATTDGYCDYDNIPANSLEYGRLYNLFAMKDARQIAPAGWHVPTLGEWITLLNYLGGAGVAGGRMKETGSTHWLSPNTGADNSSGFTALGGGSRFTAGNFGALKNRAVFWSSSSSYTPGSAAFITNVHLVYNSTNYSFQFGSIGGGERFGLSIRCVKD